MEVRPGLTSSTGSAAFEDLRSQLSPHPVRGPIRRRLPVGTALHQDLRERILLWLESNPGKYPKDIAREFGISGLAASGIVGELLGEGLLDFEA